VTAAVVLTRDSAGKVEVKEHGGGLIAKGDYEATVKAVNEGDEKIIEAIES